MFKDLPLLEFWNSPASMIQRYLECNFFQKRLQVAYEYNQKKDSCLIPQDLSVGATDHFSQAVHHLARAKIYFESIANKKALESLVTNEGKVDENRAIWDKLENFNSEKISRSFIELKIQKKQRKGSKIEPYSNLYRLKNLRSVDDGPLNKTIDLSPHLKHVNLIYGNFESKSGIKSVVEKISDKEENEFIKTEQIISVDHESIKKTKQRQILVAVNSEELSKDSNPLPESYRRLPKIQRSSLDTFQENIMFQYIPDQSYDSNEPSLPDMLPVYSTQNIQMRKLGSLVASRDSDEQVQKSKCKITLSKKNEEQTSTTSLAYHRDSLTSTSKRLGKYKTSGISNNLSNNRELLENLNINSEFSGNKDCDSIFVTLKRREKNENGKTSSTCDICNKNFKSVHILCSIHSKMALEISPSKKDVSSTKSSMLAYRDSLEIIRRKMSVKDGKISTGCQTQEINETTQDIVINTKNNINQLSKNEANKTKYNMLNDYLLQSMQINQIK